MAGHLRPIDGDRLMKLRSRLVGSLGAFLSAPANPAQLEELRSEVTAYHSAVLAGAVQRENRSPASRQSVLASILRDEFALVLAGDAPDRLLAQAQRYIDEDLAGHIKPPLPPLRPTERHIFNNPTRTSR